MEEFSKKANKKKIVHPKRRRSSGATLARVEVRGDPLDKYIIKCYTLLHKSIKVGKDLI